MTAPLTQSILSLLTVRSVLLIAVAFFILSWVEQIVRHRFFSPIRNFPGPFWASVTRLWIAYHCIKGDEVEVELDLHRKYGSVLRISPTMLLVSDAERLPDIYTRNANKSQYYVTGAFGNTPSMFHMKSHDEHAYYKKISAGPYAFSNIKKMETLIDARMREWVDAVRDRFSETEKHFNFAPWAVYLAYDVISEIAFGEPIGSVQTLASEKAW